MLKFVKHSMENIAGIEIFPLISLGIFFVFFVVVTVMVFTKDKKLVEYMSNMPLENEGYESGNH